MRRAACRLSLLLVLLGIVPLAGAANRCPKGFALEGGRVCVPVDPSGSLLAHQCMTCMPPICRCLYKADICKAAPQMLLCDAARDRCPAAPPPAHGCTLHP